jgi:hypothetical protein
VSGPSIDVVELTPELERDYAAFIARQPDAMIYPTIEYRNFLRAAVGGTPRYLVARRGSEIVGALPYFVLSHPRFGEVINSLPWYGSHGGCQVSADAPDARAALLARLRDAVAADAVRFATVILTPEETAHVDAYRAALETTNTDHRIGQVTELPDAGDDLEARLEATCLQKTRNLVRKSRNQGFTIETADTDEGWHFLYETHVANMSAMGGRAKPLPHFDALRASIPAEWRQMLQVRHEGTAVASVLLLRFNRTVEYVTPVIKHEFRSMQPLSFAIWHGMLNAVRDGFRYWNWGGTWASQTTLHHFKAGWGARDRPYSYVIRATSDALDLWQQCRAELVDAYPYYFLYPYDPAVTAASNGRA